MVIDAALFDAWLAQWRAEGDHDPIQDFISEKTGLVPKNDRYAVVLGGLVVDWIGSADPLLGHFSAKAAEYPGAQFIASDTAGVGWTYDGQKFTAPPLTAEEAQNAARKATIPKVEP